MNTLTQAMTATGIRISSRDIAVKTGKQHKNVVRDILKMLEELKIDALRFEHIYLDARNREQTEYMLDEKHALCLASGYSVKLRMAIIEEVERLKASERKPLSFEEQVKLTLGMAQEKIDALECKVKEDAPKVGLHDLKHECGTAISGKEFSDRLPIGANKLYNLYREWGWMCAKGSNNPTAPKRYAIERGYLKSKTTTLHRSDGTPFERVSPRITEKGQLRTIEKLRNLGVIHASLNLN